MAQPMPFEFILEWLHPKEVIIKPMFGCHSLYADGKIIFFLRKREDKPETNGVWVAASAEHIASLALVIGIAYNAGKKTGNQWLIIPEDDEQFESKVRKACSLALADDMRIGKVTRASAALEM